MIILNSKDKPIINVNQYINLDSPIDVIIKDLHYTRQINKIALSNYDDYINHIKQNYLSKPVNGDIIYFSSNSEYPRFKLKDSSLKRCLKKENCTKIAINYIPGDCWLSKYKVYETSSNYYIFNENRYRAYSTDNKKIQIYNSDPIKYIIDNKLYLGEDIHNIYEGRIVEFSEKEEFFVDEILNNKYKFILDNDIDEFINSNLPTITEEELNSIIELFNSPDQSNKVLGLKILEGYNINKMAYTLKLILTDPNYNIFGLREVNSVGIKQILNSLNIQRMYNFPHMPSLPENISEEDKILSRKIIINKINNFLNSNMQKLNCDNILDIFNIKVNYNIE